MIAVTHQTFGITFGLITVFFLQLFNIQPNGIGESLIFFVLVLLGSLLPDLDTPKSKLGRKFWPISFIISLFVKHRTATHSLLFVAVVGAVSGILFATFSSSWFFILAITVGTSSHIVGDWLTKRGVPFLYPFKKERFKAPITFETDGFVEKILCLVLIGINILLFIVLV